MDQKWFKVYTLVVKILMIYLQYDPQNVPGNVGNQLSSSELTLK